LLIDDWKTNSDESCFPSTISVPAKLLCAPLPVSSEARYRG
jgi:hypothetical protein